MAERADRGIALGVRLSQRDPNGRFAASGSLCADEAAQKLRLEPSARSVLSRRPRRPVFTSRHGRQTAPSRPSPRRGLSNPENHPCPLKTEPSLAFRRSLPGSLRGLRQSPGAPGPWAAVGDSQSAVRLDSVFSRRALAVHCSRKAGDRLEPRGFHARPQADLPSPTAGGQGPCPRRASGTPPSGHLGQSGKGPRACKCQTGKWNCQC